MLQTKDSLVSRLISLECDADCTNYISPPILIKKTFRDFVGGSCLVVYDDPFISEIWYANVMVPKSHRGDSCCEDAPLLAA